MAQKRVSATSLMTCALEAPVGKAANDPDFLIEEDGGGPRQPVVEGELVAPAGAHQEAGRRDSRQLRLGPNVAPANALESTWKGSTRAALC